MQGYYGRLNRNSSRTLLLYAAAAMVAFSIVAGVARAQISPQMSAGIQGARFVPVYSVSERANALRKVLKLASLPSLGRPLSLTPDTPFAKDGSHLSFWKPSFVIGTPSGGEAGVNFWGIYNQGHVNVGFTPSSAKSVVLDCRLLSTGDITYKVYEGMASEPVSQGAMALYDGHLLLIVPVARRGESISVELWPTTVESPMGFLGCEISTLK